MSIAFIVLSIFAAIWACTGLHYAGAPPALLALPVLISAGLWLAARSALSRQVTSPERARAVRRLIPLWSTIEGVAIFLAANALAATGHNALISQAICAIVGLHFLPLARGLQVPTYYLTGTAMVVAALAGALTPAPYGALVSSFAAALTLWATAVALWSQANRTPAFG